ncbi:MAG: cupin domain-containing protein [Acidimicrobiia bacterium]|nr:cupin domain-containing protein [Acidimicrobiia bacterium]
MAYTYLENVADGIEIPAAGTLSRTLYKDDDMKVVVFAFDSGEELSEHTSSSPAVIQVLRGHLRLTLDGEVVEAASGSWVHMTAGLRHAVRAAEPTVMLLTLLRDGD